MGQRRLAVLMTFREYASQVGMLALHGDNQCARDYRMHRHLASTPRTPTWAPAARGVSVACCKLALGGWLRVDVTNDCPSTFCRE